MLIRVTSWNEENSIQGKLNFADEKLSQCSTENSDGLALKNSE
jgi:hypothetical protein